MKKHSIVLDYDFYGKEYEFLVKDHTEYARLFLKDEYGVDEKCLDKLIMDFDLIYQLEENTQYLGTLHKIFYLEAVEEYKKECENNGK